LTIFFQPVHADDGRKLLGGAAVHLGLLEGYPDIEAAPCTRSVVDGGRHSIQVTATAGAKMD
jgi:hypothetical protein